LFKTLKQPFPRPENTFVQKALNSFYEGIGVFFFFWFFQPFGINGWEVEYKSFYLAAYGVIVFLVTLCYRLVLPALFPRYFDEKNWTVGREIAGVLLILVSITACILMYHGVIFKGLGNQFAEARFIFFLVVVIGSIPITISVLSRFTYLYKKYNQQIAVSVTPEKVEILRLTADNGKDVLTVNDLLYIESADNYCSVVFLKDSQLQKELVRSSLGRLETQINNPKVVRCHRSFIVNLSHVKTVTGNAQGYKFHLDIESEIIPVARKYSNLVEAIRP
jgi:hypothetical protein